MEGAEVWSLVGCLVMRIPKEVGQLDSAGWLRENLNICWGQNLNAARKPRWMLGREEWDEVGG